MGISWNILRKAPEKAGTVLRLSEIDFCQEWESLHGKLFEKASKDRGGYFTGGF